MSSHRLIVNLIIDNSANMVGVKHDLLVSELNRFIRNLQGYLKKQSLEISIVSFNDFEPECIMNFSQIPNDIHVESNKFPLLGKALMYSLKLVEQRLTDLDKQGVQYHKPWIVLFSNGISYDTSIQAYQHYNQLGVTKQPVIFPFLLSSEMIDENTKAFEQHKLFITIRDNLFHKMFDWLINLIEHRIHTDVNQSIRLNKSDMLEWIKQ